MVVNDRPLKRPRRNRVTADLYDFFTFPASEELAYGGEPFRENIKLFLSSHARLTYPPSLFPPLVTWQILFRVGDLMEGPDLSPVVVALDIVEEDVTRSTRSVYCNQCRVVGWSGHPVCRKRYHFIIRSHHNRSPVEGYQMPCNSCGNLLHLSESRCKWCDSLITTEDLEEWIYSQFDDNTHLLHGVVHANGFGHLLTVNGKEGGSRVLTGHDIMNFWDGLSARLAVRKVSVMDVSRKNGMEYRLLHTIICGHPWYGNWGYEFGSGSYALTLDAYQNAVETLSNVPLGPLLFHGRGPRTRLQAVISLYQSLSDLEVLTLKDLFSSLLRLIHGGSGSTKAAGAPKNLVAATSKVLCAWTRDDVESVQRAMIKVLATASSETNWVTRRSLKGVLCKTASAELLDYCLKHLGGKFAASGMVVQTQLNSNTCDIEFRLVPVSFMHCEARFDSNYPSKEQVKHDLKYLFDSLIRPETMVDYGPQAMRDTVINSAAKLLDSKQFMKDYRPDKRMVNDPFVIQLLCHLELPDQPREDQVIPPELLILPSTATAATLKNEAARAFQEVYAMFNRLEVNELREYGFLEDSITLKFLVGQHATLRIKGTCPSKHALNHFRMERGTEKWTVDCNCGAKDDDGEPMLACDSCSVWQHTRCAGIDGSDAIPAKFMCLRCKNLYRKKSEKISNLREPSDKVALTQTATCRVKAVENDNVTTENKLTLAFRVS